MLGINPKCLMVSRIDVYGEAVFKKRKLLKFFDFRKGGDWKFFNLKKGLMGIGVEPHMLLDLIPCLISIERDGATGEIEGPSIPICDNFNYIGVVNIFWGSLFFEGPNLLCRLIHPLQKVFNHLMGDKRVIGLPIDKDIPCHTR